MDRDGAGRRRGVTLPDVTRDYTPATLAVTAGRPDHTPGNPVNPPVVLSSTYVSQGPVVPGDPLYARMDTETWQPFEEALAVLERAELPALVFGSGLAASAAALALVPPGGRIVLPRHAYQLAVALIDDLRARSGIEPVAVDIADTAAAKSTLDTTTSFPSCFSKV